MAAVDLIMARNRASHLKCLLAELKQQLDLLTKATIVRLCAEEEKKIILENDQLKYEVIQLKNKLVQLETNNNKKQVLLPSTFSSNRMILPLVEKSKIEQSKPNVEIAKCNGLTANDNSLKKIEKKLEDKLQKKPPVKHESKLAAEVPVDDKVDASRLNMRIGLIVDVKKHPDADSLYVESVDVGEAKPRTIVSGLVNHVPIEHMKDRVAVFLLNLKPAKMRGVLSEGMIMCASTPEKVEIISVPEGATIGERVTVDGYEGEADEQLNTKKKIWEQIQPDLKINADGFATYKGSLWKDGQGKRFKAITMKNCQIK